MPTLAGSQCWVIRSQNNHAVVRGRGITIPSGFEPGACPVGAATYGLILSR